MFRMMKKLVVFSTVAVMLLSISGIVNAASFTDCAGRTDEKLISECSEKGLISGFPNGTYQPTRLITRAEFITIANRAFNFTATAEINFSDVSSSAWYAKEIAKAVAAGYISNSNVSFNPKDYVYMSDSADMLGLITKKSIPVESNLKNRKLNRVEALALIYDASGGNAAGFLPAILPSSLVNAVQINGTSITLTGVLIDEHCFAFKDPASDTKMCLMMEKCKESGYGAAVLKPDGSYEFYKFDDAGQKLAIETISATKKMKNIIIEVKGTYEDGIVKVSSLSERIDSTPMSLSGIIIDEHCFAFKDPASDTKMCLMMEKCKASGYGAAVMQADNTYKFYKFDAAGQTLAVDIIANSTKMKNITVEVKGAMDGEIFKVSSIQEK